MEDIYTYKKGVGWVLGPDCDFWETTHNGKRLRFEHRKPEIGERFYYLHMFSDSIFNGKIQFEKMFKGLISWAGNMPDYNAATLTEERCLDDVFGPNYTHIVLTIAPDESLE